jgi:mannose/fructose/N-acetylgalactosamine-specific phosphotransferase system component IIB
VAKGKQQQRVLVVLKQPQRVLDGTEFPQIEIRVVAVGECHAQHPKTLKKRKKGPQNVLVVVVCF